MPVTLRPRNAQGRATTPHTRSQEPEDAPKVTKKKNTATGKDKTAPIPKPRATSQTKRADKPPAPKLKNQRQSAKAPKAIPTPPLDNPIDTTLPTGQLDLRSSNLNPDQYHDIAPPSPPNQTTKVKRVVVVEDIDPAKWDALFPKVLPEGESPLPLDTPTKDGYLTPYYIFAWKRRIPEMRRLFQNRKGWDRRWNPVNDVEHNWIMPRFAEQLPEVDARFCPQVDLDPDLTVSLTIAFNSPGCVSEIADPDRLERIMGAVYHSLGVTDSEEEEEELPRKDLRWYRQV